MTDRAVTIAAANVTVTAVLHDTPTAEALWDALPISASANTWGDEIYFGIGIGQDLDDTAQEVVELGAVGYWPPGDALCLFFGPTPMSTGDEIRPASAVNVVGQIQGDPAVLKQIPGGASITVEVA